MRHVAAILLVLSLRALPVEAQTHDGWPTHLAIGSYMTLNGADLSTTMFLLGSSRGREANPILAPFSAHPVAFGAFKMGAASATSAVLLRLHRTRPRLAFWLAVAGSGMYAAVVRHNARMLSIGTP